MLEIDQLAKCLLQLLIKHKCIKERNFVELINGRSRINIILNKMNDLLKFSGYFVSIELINGEEYFVINSDFAFQPTDLAQLVKNKGKRTGEGENGGRREKRARGVSLNEIENEIENKREDEIRESVIEGSEVQEGEIQKNDMQKKKYIRADTNCKTISEINARGDGPLEVESEEVKNLRNEKPDQNNSHANNLDNAEHLYHEADSVIHELDMDSENNFRNVGIFNESCKAWDLIPEEMLYSCKLKKSELAIYYFIVDYILKNQKFLKIYNDECTFENMCSELKINTKEHQTTVLNRLLNYNWIKIVNENEITLGKRFYTDLINCVIKKGNAVCLSCKNPLVVEYVQCENCLCPYHKKCMMVLKNNKLPCLTCTAET